MKASTHDLLEYERALLDRGEVVVGIDEVGRGALAGPMTVGAVVIREERPPPAGLNDSKLLTPAQRTSLVDPLSRWAFEWSLGSVSAFEIDEWGLRLALAVAATRALNALTSSPTHALIDGSINLLRSPLNERFGSSAPPPLSYGALPVTTIVKGDQRCATIAAAAVLAKVDRDAHMVALHEEFVEYQWARNKGYGTTAHLEAIRRLGRTSSHRLTWHVRGATSSPKRLKSHTSESVATSTGQRN